MACPEAADVAVDDIACNVLMGTVAAWLALLLPRSPAAAVPRSTSRPPLGPS